MRKLWIVVLMASLLAAAGLAPPPRAQAAGEASRVALIVEGPGERGAPGKAPIQYAKHDLCGIGLGGYCPGRYRSCLRAGRPPAECEVRYERCQACSQEMLACRQKVGHEPGFNCPECRAALNKCRASIGAPVK